MRPLYQRVIGTGFGPPYGDCLKCCVASVLDLEYEDVPNFIDPSVNGESDWYDFLNTWVGEHHKLEVHGCDYADDGELLFTPEPPYVPEALVTGGFWIATVRSAVFEPKLHGGRLVPSTHSIVMYRDKPVFDPLPVPCHPPYEYCGDMWFEELATRQPRGEPDV